jgi:hypothetical protein
MKKNKQVILILLLEIAISLVFLPKESKAGTLPNFKDGCLTLTNADSFSEYKFFYLAGGHPVNPFYELTTGDCIKTDPIEHVDSWPGGKVYAIKNADVNAFKSAVLDYKNWDRMSGSSEDILNYYNTSYLPTINRIGIAWAKNYRDLFVNADLNVAGIEIEAKVNNVGSQLNISVTKSILILKNGIRQESGTATAKPTPAPTPTMTKPAVPTLSTLNEVAIPESKTFTNSIREGQKITLSGKTTPNIKVKLYIYSEPKTAEITSDKDGNWTYTIENLERGDHKVEASTIDSAGVESDKVELAKFTIKEKLVPIEPTKAEPYKFKLTDLLNATNYILVGALIVFIGVLVYLIFRRRSQNNLVQ